MDKTEKFIAVVSDSVRGLVDIVQEKGIKKENIVQVIQDNHGDYIMFCFE